jgi:hypothetical protein
VFSPLEAGLFITESVDLIDRYDLRVPCVQAEGGLVLGHELGPLNNHQILHLLSTAITRLTANWQHQPSSQDYWVHGTIQALYRGFSKSFLQKFPCLPDEQFLYVNSFLDRASQILVGHPLAIQCCTVTRRDSEFALDLGEMLVELLFPSVPQDGPIEVPSSTGDESQPGWLEDMAAQLDCMVPKMHRP